MEVMQLSDIHSYYTMQMLQFNCASGGGVTAPGVGSVVFLSEEERQNSITVIATSVNIVSRSTSSQITTQITIGNETGASQTITKQSIQAGGLS